MPEKIKASSFGGATFSRTSPEKLTDETKMVNVVLPFEEALKLSVAVQACVMWLNEKNRATKEGKGAALNLQVNFARRRVVVRRVRGKAKPVNLTAE